MASLTKKRSHSRKISPTEPLSGLENFISTQKEINVCFIGEKTRIYKKDKIKPEFRRFNIFVWFGNETKYLNENIRFASSSPDKYLVVLLETLLNYRPILAGQVSNIGIYKMNEDNVESIKNLVYNIKKPDGVLLIDADSPDAIPDLTMGMDCDINTDAEWGDHWRCTKYKIDEEEEKIIKSRQPSETNVYNCIYKPCPETDVYNKKLSRCNKDSYYKCIYEPTGGKKTKRRKQ